MSFFIHLPSNGSLTYYPNNTLSKYSNKLPKKVCFRNSDYEVALSEISYVHSIKTFEGKNDNIISIKRKNLENSKIEFHIPLKHFYSIDELIDTINLLIPEEYKHAVQFNYSTVKNRVFISFKFDIIISLSKKLSNILGFEENCLLEHLENDGSIIANKYPDIKDGKYHLYVYTDIIQPQIVGSAYVPLLRMINIEGKEGEIRNITFQNLQYLQLSRSDFDTISVVLCNEFGEEYQMDKGFVSLTLHFKIKK